MNNIGNVTVTNGKIATLEYSKSGKKCTYYATVPAELAGKTTDGNYNVEK